jgi:DegV family protein with EDD domain
MARKFEIVTDSGADMSEEYLEKNNVTCVKLGFTMNNVHYEGECGERISPKTFYGKLREGATPTTYQVTCETAKKYLVDILENKRDILIITFSSALSGTADSFALAARQLCKKYKNRKIIVVDSLCASMGEGLLLDYVVKKADEGATIEETAKYAEHLKLKICHHFTVDNLFHLKRGGRVSATTAIVGSILKIKPILKVDNSGKLVSVGKAMGRKKSLKTLVDNVVACKDMDEEDEIFISHGDCIEDVEYVKTLLKEKMPKVKITVGYVGNVIGSHSGPGTLAIFHKGKSR